ncbi:reverse transcriptase-like protein [Micrococcus sp. FDAARGOS_333]|uniref:reverse transcriptase-like protein n=1 Tax=Micrococcus sp. FDAARGOS_333 TaxID=1930558 RepID=UPI000B4DEF8F|nr:reverse transcriptase-like protein [Micrococcus sp. FDAARGOS_333]PNL17859.1 ribonuclease HI [Micrococcus sp. FDAARGOS_333]
MSERVLQVEADGGSRGNPGIAGYGALVRDPVTGDVLMTEAGPLGRASNNVAEYSGLIAGLKMARLVDPSARVHVLMDSKLVVEQMSGRWRIKHEDMRRLAAEARSLYPAGRVDYEWIPRAENKDADRLSNEAMDAGAKGVDWDAGASEVTVAALDASGPEPTDARAVVADDEEPAAPAASGAAETALQGLPGRLHHVEVWVADLEAAERSLGWMLEQLGYECNGRWKQGRSYQGAGEYIVLESGADVADGAHERRRPGLNHLAFMAGTRAQVDALTELAQEHGFSLMFEDTHPFAGGRGHYAAYLETEDGFEVELVATA